MIVLEQNVYDVIESEFPKKHIAIREKVDNYATQLSKLIYEFKLKHSGYATQLPDKVFDISLERLRGDQRVRVNGKMVYLHTWLLNKCPLFRIVKTGNIYTQQLSQIELTSNARYEDILMTNELTGSNEYTDEEVMNAVDNANRVFYMMFPDWDSYTPEEILDKYDFSPINVTSVQGYINWISNPEHTLKPSKKKIALYQAKTLIALAKADQVPGYLPQLKNKSEFGRTYYRGLSVQNMNKQLREAALGGLHVSYDARSSAIAWKLKYAAKADPTNLFLATKQYCENKSVLIDQVYDDITAQYPDKTIYKPYLKKAFSSLTFGANLTSTYSYYDKSNGKEVVISLGEILKDSEVRKAFIAHPYVVAFNEEQTILENYIFNDVKDLDYIKNLQCLRTGTGKIKKSKVISYLYQQEESKFMADVVSMIEAYHNSFNCDRDVVIAKIHDGIITDSPLSTSLLDKIHTHVRTTYGIEYFQLTSEQVREYHEVPTAYQKEQAASFTKDHKDFLIAEQQRAVEFAKSRLGAEWEVQKVEEPVIDETKLWMDFFDQIEDPLDAMFGTPKKKTAPKIDYNKRYKDY